MQQRQINWVRKWEHPTLRVVSVALSAVSANAVLWFYSSMDHVPGAVFLQPYIKWCLAIALTLFGYFASRGLAHRLLNRERVGVYVLIAVVLEMVEVVTNFMQSAVAVHNIEWLYLFSGGFLTLMQVLVYLVMPIVPIMTVAIAWVDMDLERKKEGAGHVPSPAPRYTPTAAAAPASKASPLAQRTATMAPAPPPAGRGTVPAGYGSVTQQQTAVRQGNGAMTQQPQQTTVRQGGGFQFPYKQRDDGQMPGLNELLLDPAKQVVP